MVLEAKGAGEYEGTFTGSGKDKPAPSNAPPGGGPGDGPQGFGVSPKSGPDALSDSDKTKSGSLDSKSFQSLNNPPGGGLLGAGSGLPGAPGARPVPRADSVPAGGGGLGGTMPNGPGTALDSGKGKSGTLHLKWSRLERRFNGIWGKGAARTGTMSLRLVDKEIRGGWTTDEDVQLETGTPLLGDLLWTRGKQIDQETAQSNFTQAERAVARAQRAITRERSQAASEQVQNNSQPDSKQPRFDNHSPWAVGATPLKGPLPYTTGLTPALAKLRTEFSELDAVYHKSTEKAADEAELKNRPSKVLDPREIMPAKYLAFEEKQRGSRSGLEALAEVAKMAQGVIHPTSNATKGRAEVADRVIKHYLDHPGLVAMAEIFEPFFIQSDQSDGFLQALVEKSPHRKTQAEALIAQCIQGKRLLRLEPQLPTIIRSQMESIATSDDPPQTKTELQNYLKKLEMTDFKKLRADLNDKLKRLADDYSEVNVSDVNAQHYGTGGVAAQKLAHAINKVTVGAEAPEIEVADINGEWFRLSKLRGDIVVLLFSEGGEDYKEMYGPLRSLVAKYRERVRFVGIMSTDDQRKLRAASKRGDLTWTVIPQPLNSPLRLDWGIEFDSPVYIVDAEGILQPELHMPYYGAGGYDARAVDDKLAELLRRPRYRSSGFAPLPGQPQPTKVSGGKVGDAVNGPGVIDPKSLAAAVNRFNSETADVRSKLFAPPIPDLTVERLREGFRQSATYYRGLGNRQVADALEKIAESGELPKEAMSELIGSGVYAQDEMGRTIYRQVVPALVLPDDTTSTGSSLVVLRPLELMFRKDGPASKDYGDQFAQGTAMAPGIEQPLDRKNARAVVEAWVAAGLAGRIDQAASLIDQSEIAAEDRPGVRPAIRVFFKQFNVQQLAMKSVYVNDPAKPTTALAISESVKLARKQPDGQRDSFLVVTLTMSEGGWLLSDEELESEESADRELKKFVEANPKATSVPTQREAQAREARANPLVGHWKLVKLADMPVDQLVGATVVIDEHRVKMHVPSQKAPHPDWRYTLGANGDLDLVDADDAKGESIVRAKYSLKGKALYLALNAKKGDHPRPESATGDVPQEGVQYIVLELDEEAKSSEATKAPDESHGKREGNQQGPEQPALSKTLRQLQGKWHLTRQIAPNGDESTPGRSTWEFKGDRIIARDPGGTMLIQVDESHSPVHVDLSLETEDESGLGLLTVEKDKLTLCLGKSQKTPVPERRPEKLQWVSGVWYMELRRVKPGETIVPLKPKRQPQLQEAPSFRASPIIPSQNRVDESKAPAVVKPATDNPGTTSPNTRKMPPEKEPFTNSQSR